MSSSTSDMEDGFTNLILPCIALKMKESKFNGVTLPNVSTNCGQIPYIPNAYRDSHLHVEQNKKIRLCICQINLDDLAQKALKLETLPESGIIQIFAPFEIKITNNKIKEIYLSCHDESVRVVYHEDYSLPVDLVTSKAVEPYYRALYESSQKSKYGYSSCLELIDYVSRLDGQSLVLHGKGDKLFDKHCLSIHIGGVPYCIQHCTNEFDPESEICLFHIGDSVYSLNVIMKKEALAQRGFNEIEVYLTYD